MTRLERSLSVLVVFAGLPALPFRLDAQPTIPYREGEDVRLASGDLNLDDVPDLVLLRRLAELVTVHTTRPFPGGFLEETDAFETEENTWSLLTGPVDDDVFVDVVVRKTAGSYTIARGGGSGRIAVSGKLSIEPVRVRGSAALVEDIDGDGILDVLLTDEEFDLVLVSPMTSNRNAVSVATAVELPEVVGAGDFDGDGRKDLLAWGRSTQPSVTVHRALEDGGFEDHLAIDRPPSPGGFPHGVVSDDLDRDGRDEFLLLAQVRPGEEFLGFLYLLELERNGRHSFRRLGPELRTEHAVSREFPLFIRDMNGDGRLDIVLRQRGDGGSEENVFWFLLQDEGPGLEFRPCIFRPGERVASAAPADFDGDDVLDLALALPAPSEVRVVFSPLERCEPLAGCFSTPMSRPSGAAAGGILAARFPGDGEKKVVLAGGGADARILSVEPPDVREVSMFGAPSDVVALAAGDLDADGHADVALADAASGSIHVVFLDGEHQRRSSLELPLGGQPAGLVTDDLDGDRLADLAVSLADRDRVAVLFQDEGEPRFTPVILPAGPSPAALAAGDLDGDGTEDLVAVNDGTTRISIIRGKGRRSFDAPRAERVIPDPRAVAVRDLDGDRRDDIVVGSRRTDGVTVLLGSTGGFEPRFVQLPHGSLPTALAVADLDVDGAPEVAVASSGPSSVTVLENDGGGDLRVEGLASYRFRPMETPGDLYVFLSDYDADGLLDLLTVSSATGELAFYRSRGCGGEVEFRRGDADQDGRLLLTDAIVILSHLFLDGSRISCEDAGDANDDGLLDLTDAVVVLSHLFGPADELPAPGPSECGIDPTADDLRPCTGRCP